MKLSAPIYQLKRKAKLLSREAVIPLNEALDRIAVQEGFTDWSLLVAKASAMTDAGKLFSRLTPGDLVLIGARPGQGKTRMSMELTIEAMKSGYKGVLFTLEYTERDVRNLFQRMGMNLEPFGKLFESDCSDDISADHIVKRLATAPRSTLVVVDYLQLLDQRRENPDLSVQVQKLKEFAQERGLIIVFISQIDRSYDPSEKRCPDIRDIRLPNPLNLSLFSKMCFLHDGEVRYRTAS